ncbi:AMP-binding protein [Streptomyces sp. NBC_00024]|uniref:AMP-binding protein n=1 Tax=Streptomyces sp. NBC_00024 TaxID=2903612 RepID=UPI0032521720
MAHLTYPGLPVDGLLRTAAARSPDSVAVRAARTALSYGELDAQAGRIAAFVQQETAGRPGVHVAVAGVLDDPVFAAAYYGVIRAGATVVLVNPLTGKDGLRYVLAAAAARIALVPLATARLPARTRDALPALRTLVVMGPPDGTVPSGCLPLRTALDTAPDAPAEHRPRPGHRRLRAVHHRHHRPAQGCTRTVANARQTALAHLVRAGIVLRETPGNHDGDGPLHVIAARADERLAPFGRVRLTEACDAVPRTPTGKPARALVRTRLRARAAVGPFTPTP